MTVLVTGGTGFVGRGLVPALVAAGHRVRLAVRDPARVAAAPEIEAVAIPDLAGPVDWRPLLADATAVVHLAGIAHAMGGLPEERYEAVNHHATARLAAACAAARVHLVFVSSVRAQCGPSADRVLTEDDPPVPTDAYGRAKLAAERAVHAAGGPHTILRPVLVHGPGVGGNFGQLERLAATPLPLPFGALRNRRSLVARDTLVAAILWAMAAPQAVGLTFLVADPGAPTTAELVATLRRRAGRSPRLLPVPPALLRGLLRLAGRGAVADRLGGSLVVSTDALAGAGFRWPDAASAPALGGQSRL